MRCKRKKRKSAAGNLFLPEASLAPGNSKCAGYISALVTWLRQKGGEMSTGATIHSRLQILIAKSIRAEKIYASIRHTKGLETASIAEIANDIRAKEWHRAYFQLRSHLNQIMHGPKTTALARQLVALYYKFNRVAEESVRVVQADREKLVETARRDEFAHSLRLSVDLVKLRARAQANRVIADELAAILQLSGRTINQSDYPNEPELSLEYHEASLPPFVMNSNVIPLRRFKRR